SEIELKMFGQNRVDLAVGVYKDIIQVKSKNKDEILYNLVSAAFDSGIVKHFVLSKPKSINYFIFKFLTRFFNLHLIRHFKMYIFYR
ncbi:unnamed protein product, partial [marine sediment metagenome]